MPVEDVLSDEDRLRAGLLLALSGARWEDFSEVGCEPGEIAKDRNRGKTQV